MPHEIVYSGSAVASSGARLAFTRKVAVEGCNVIVATVATGDTVDVDLGVGASALQLLGVRSTDYNPDPAAPTLTMKIGGGAARPFDQPLLIAGAVAADLLGATPSLAFTNNLFPAKDVTVEIIVGRDATP
ncbi:MAG: hypothetical protein ACXW5U_05035 [Thermoanaerobaculia bacterium]